MQTNPNTNCIRVYKCVLANGKINVEVKEISLADKGIAVTIYRDTIFTSHSMIAPLALKLTCVSTLTWIINISNWEEISILSYNNKSAQTKKCLWSLVTSTKLLLDP